MNPLVTAAARVTTTPKVRMVMIDVVVLDAKAHAIAMTPSSARSGKQGGDCRDDEHYQKQHEHQYEQRCSVVFDPIRSLLNLGNMKLR